VTPGRVERCSAAWTDKGLLDSLVPLADTDAMIHNCHRAKDHVGDHVCACGKKLAR
jgi:hypothetical protein